MTHTLAMEWAKYGIRVNSVSPGLVKTAMTYWVPQQPDWEQQLKYYGGIPRLAEVQELGGAYVYLLSDAASYTTSIDIPVNGVIGSEFTFKFSSLKTTFTDRCYSLLMRMTRHIPGGRKIVYDERMSMHDSVNFLRLDRTLILCIFVQIYGIFSNNILSYRSKSGLALSLDTANTSILPNPVGALLDLVFSLMSTL